MKIRKLCLGGAMILGVVALAGCQRQANTEPVVQEAVEQVAEPSGAPEKKDVTIYLVRHGKTFLTPQDRYRDGRIHLLQRKGNPRLTRPERA